MIWFRLSLIIIQKNQQISHKSNPHPHKMLSTQQKQTQQLPETPIIKPQYSNINVIRYIKSKCDLSQSEIQTRLKNGTFFDIKGQGNQLDSKLIQNVLIENDFYQKQSQKLFKQQAMKFVKSIVEEWSLNIARTQKQINKDQAANYTAKVLAFGSHVLDLKSNNSDIDLVCVVPNFVNRETHFFEGLASKFDKEIEVKGLSVIRSAKVPIITFDYKQINIDISFCKLQDQTIPRDIQRVINMDLINKIKDQKSRTSIMGRKNNLMIMELAGPPSQTQNFKQTLRIIKVWAKNRGISSNAMGFLGGISWAIMLAKVCQIFPNHKSNKLLAEFFNIYRLWNWKQMAVALIEPSKQDFDNAQPQKSQMIVFTPGNHYNSTIRVNKIIFEVIKKQIQRASQILMFKRGDFQTLCEKVNFINSYDFFIEIDICGTEEKEYKDFFGSVESKILILLNSIIAYNKKDLEKGLKIVPFPKSYKKNDTKYPICNTFFIGVSMTSPADITRAVCEWGAILDKQRINKEDRLSVRIFQCSKEDFMTDVETSQAPPKKQEKEDPRLAMRARKG